VGDIFISYASEDRSRVRPLADALSDRGWRVWWDREIQAGRTFDDAIAEAIANARCVVVVWSRASVASSWVREEADEGRKRGVLIPVLIDDVSPPLGFGRIQAAPMIDWGDDPESEAFQKFADDIAALIGPPSRRDAEPEIAARDAPERVPAAPSIGRRAARYLRQHKVRLTLAGAALIALALSVSIALYRVSPFGGDRSQPPQTFAASDTTALKLTAILTDGGEPIPEGVAYDVYAVERDAEGNRKRIEGSLSAYGPPRLTLPAGRYFVTATYGSASADVEVDVKPGGITHQHLNLRAGILRPAAILAEGSEPLPEGAAYDVYAVEQDADGNRKRIDASLSAYGPPRLPLPAGRYYVTAQYGSASANVEVEVRAGDVIKQMLNLRAGILRPTAIMAVGREALPEGVAYDVYTVERDAEGNRKRVDGSLSAYGPPRLPLPAGRYFVTAEYGSASANMEVEVTPGRVINQVLNLHAGILRPQAILDGKPLPIGVAYDVYTASRDAEGNRKRVDGSLSAYRPPRLPLPVGRYYVTATHSSGASSAETQVTPGGVHDLQLQIVPASKR
jgi:hypothetical protein